MRNNVKYALVTGASHGLGKELAKALARRKHNLILVSLPGENLQGIANALSDEYDVLVRWYECDLTLKQEIDNLIRWVSLHFSVNILINNAGVGCAARFMELSAEQTDRILMLNMRSVVLLTHGLLPLLMKQPQAFILNIASLASFLPMPFKSIYPASKAFIYSFSRGLYAELKGSNVLVGVAHPGGMATNFEVSRRIREAGSLTRATILSVEQTAEICIRRLLKKHPFIIPGFLNKFVWLATRIIPVRIILSYLKNNFQNGSMKKMEDMTKVKADSNTENEKKAAVCE